VSFLLDTTVVSKWMKPLPDPSVIRWLAEVDEDRVYLSVMTLADLRYGTERLPAGARRYHGSKRGSAKNYRCASRAAYSSLKPRSPTLGEAS